ncbi:MAG: RNA polymerase sigma-54 factor [Propionibacteriaceae bacterium]|nr:RNA polymerase sigma-54 factor [Propionibacteriaceae bacterium]
MESRFDLGHDMRPWVSPSLIEANHILSLSRQELQEVINAELNSNPALEMDEGEVCPLCGGLLDGSYCPTCLISSTSIGEQEAYEDYPEQMTTATTLREDTDDFDPMTLVAAEISLPDQILTDARTILDPEEYPIAEYLVDALDDRGFLGCSLPEVANLTQRPLEAIESVLEVIQDVAPIGVGARDLRECLLLQLRFLTQGGSTVPAAVERIIDSHLAEFGAHKYGQIARDLSLSTEEVEEARDFIRASLNPFPMQTQIAKSWRSPSSSAYVAPDVIISVKDGELDVEVVDGRHFHLRINSMYDRLSSDLGRKRQPRHVVEVEPAQVSFDDTAEREQAETGHANGTNGNGHSAAGDMAETIPLMASDTDKTHVRQYSSRAKLFIANVQQRRETLLRISRCICELQEGFLRGGVRELRPLTRAIVAQQVGVHESTVSRATAEKYVMLPTRKVIPFSDFFTPSLSVKDVIKELIDRENGKGETLTDRKICDLLLIEGIRIARRTVAKYRAELGILPSTMR